MSETQSDTVTLKLTPEQLDVLRNAARGDAPVHINPDLKPGEVVVTLREVHCDNCAHGLACPG